MRTVLLRAADPPVQVRLGDVAMTAPLSHALPYYWRAYPEYDRAIAVLAGIVQQLSPDATMIDVGANIGDTALIARSGAPGMPVLCFEADEDWRALLRRNAEPGIEVSEHGFLGERTETVSGRMEHATGTAVFHAGNGQRRSFVTLDDALTDHPDFANAALLKTDTDGFDGPVLRGAEQLLRRTQPFLFIEYAPLLLAENGCDGLELLDWLRDLGYGPSVVYDNLGAQVAATQLGDPQIDEAARDNVAHYCDVAVFPASASDAAHTLTATTAR